MIMVEYDRTHSHRPPHYPPHSRETAHIHHLEHRSVPSTPSPPYQYALPSFGSQHQQAQTPVRSTPTSYPSPASYPSPSTSAYSYPPPQGHQSPHYQPLHSSSISLPPIRTSPHLNSIPPSIPSGSQIGSPLPPPPVHSHSYYSAPHHGHVLPTPSIISHPHLASSPLPQPLRYPLPHNVQPERIMSGGRHKKEIKRRTKTGCLTCRKRRIKCDEAHPTCKNCTKSKRECMGYDPIFKPQPGPAAIQPAPTSASGSVVTPTYARTISTAASSPASSCEPYEYPSAIDPALETAASLPPPSGLSLGRPDLKRPIDRTSPLSCASDTPRASATPNPRSNTPNDSIFRDNSLHTHPAKRIKIGDLLSGSGPTSMPLTPPSSDQASNSPNVTELFKLKYRYDYAPMMDEILETGWFETRGVARVIRGGSFVEMIATLFPRLAARKEPYVEEEDSTLLSYGGDAEILLQFIRLIYGTRFTVTDSCISEKGGDHANAADIAKREETSKRMMILEALLTGNCAIVNLGSPQSSPKSSPRQYEDPQIGLRSRFWFSLAKFVSLSRDRERETDEILEDMRSNMWYGINGSSDSIGEMKHPRNILYNIALTRHLHHKLLSGSMDKPEAADERRSLQTAFDRAKSLIEETARLDMKPYLQRICGRAAAGIWSQHTTR